MLKKIEDIQLKAFNEVEYLFRQRLRLRHGIGGHPVASQSAQDIALHPPRYANKRDG